MGGSYGAFGPVFDKILDENNFSLGVKNPGASATIDVPVFLRKLVEGFIDEQESELDVVHATERRKNELTGIPDLAGFPEGEGDNGGKLEEGALLDVPEEWRPADLR